LSGDVDINCLHVASSAALDLSTHNLTVDDVMTNYGTLTQTQTVTNTLTEFFHIKDITGTTKYRGVEISPTATFLDSVTVGIRVVDTDRGEFCTTTGAGSPVYTERCFTINPATNAEAAIRLWVLDSEQNAVSIADLTPYHWISNDWAALSIISTSTNYRANYLSAQGTTTSFSRFLLGSAAKPTAIRLNQIGARPATENVATAALLLSLASLATGFAGIWLIKRRAAPR
jgi:hypothetical protein